MLNNHQKELIELYAMEELKDNFDLFNFKDQLDSSLDYYEAKNEIAEKIEKFKENNPLEKIRRNDIKRLKEAQKDNPEILVNKWIKDSVKTSKIYGVIAKRGGGKSCFGFAFLEWHKQLVNRRCYIYKFPKPSLLPDWIINVNDISETEKGGVLLIEEGGIEFNQFSFHTKRSIELANMLKIARHRDLSVIFVAQNGANLTRDIRRLVDCYILREPSFTQLYDEISIIKKMYQNCFMLFQTDEQKLKGFFITEIGEQAFFDKPNWFIEEISKAYDGEKEPLNVSQWIKSKIKGKT